MVYLLRYISNKGLLYERDTEEHVAVTVLLLLLPVTKADCKTFCPMSRIGPVTVRPAPQRYISVSTSQRSDLCKNVSLLCYLVAAVINTYTISDDWDRSECRVPFWAHLS